MKESDFFQAFAVTIFAIAPEGIPLVRDPRFSGSPWKFAGGKGESTDESPEAGAAREFEGEVGPKIPLARLNEVYEKQKLHPVPHMYKFFEARLDSLEGIKERGDEGEIVHVFSEEEFLKLIETNQFFPPHRQLLEETGFFLKKKTSGKKALACVG